MRMLVTVKNFESIHKPEDIKRIREIVKQKTKEIHESGKVIQSGVFADARGAFFLMDVDSSTELSRLLFPMHDMAHIETHPIYSFEELGKLFSQPEGR